MIWLSLKDVYYGDKSYYLCLYKAFIHNILMRNCDFDILNFFSGEKDPSNDSVWNEFLSTLDEIGRKELMDVAQSAYSRK